MKTSEIETRIKELQENQKKNPDFYMSLEVVEMGDLAHIITERTRCITIVNKYSTYQIAKQIIAEIHGEE